MFPLNYKTAYKNKLSKPSYWWTAFLPCRRKWSQETMDVNMWMLAPINSQKLPVMTFPCHCQQCIYHQCHHQLTESCHQLQKHLAHVLPHALPCQQSPSSYNTGSFYYSPQLDAAVITTFQLTVYINKEVMCWTWGINIVCVSISSCITEQAPK